MCLIKYLKQASVAETLHIHTLPDLFFEFLILGHLIKVKGHLGHTLNFNASALVLKMVLENHTEGIV